MAPRRPSQITRAFLSDREKALQRLEEALPTAADVLVDLLKERNPVVRLQAATATFDRTIGKPVQRVAVEEKKDRPGPLRLYGDWLTAAHPELAAVWVQRILEFTEGRGPMPELPAPLHDPELEAAHEGILAWLETLRPAPPALSEETGPDA